MNEIDLTFMKMAEEISESSRCLRRKVGAILTKGNTIISEGFNMIPDGLAQCSQVGCLRTEYGIPTGERIDLCRSVHAEQVCLLEAGKDAIGSTLYVTTRPCSVCAGLIIQAKVKRVVYKDEYNDTTSLIMLNNVKIEVVKL